MQIEFSNLPQNIHQSAEEDLAVVTELAPQRGVLVPSRSIRIVSLEAGTPAQLPTHNIAAPSNEMPISFAARCNWETRRQSFQLIEEGETIWVIGGGHDGALYGVGEVLRCLTGVIWAGMQDEETLFGPARVLPHGVQSPRMAFRARDGAPPTGGLPNFVRWLNRNRYNMWRRSSSFWMTRDTEYHQSIITSCAARCVHLTLGDHAIDYFLPEEEFEEHPEWFGMRDGARTRKAFVTMPDCPHLNAVLPIQPCFSNEELGEVLTDRMAAHMREFPTVGFFGLWPHDGVNNWCQCDKCRVLTPYEQMYNLALRLEKKLPAHIPIELIAYSNLLNVPKRELPRSERTFTMLCPYLRQFKHRIYDDGGPPLEAGTKYPEPDRINPLDEREYGELFEQWKKVCEQNASVLAIFEYGPGFYDETRRTDRPRYSYHPPLEIREDEMTWYAERGVRVFYKCSWYRGWPDSYEETGFADLMWGGATSTQIREHYYQALAGEHGQALPVALAAVAETLLDEMNPQQELDEVSRVLGQWKAAGGDSDVITRYEIWCRYVEAARQVREFELAGRNAEGIPIEKEVQQLLQDNRMAIEDQVSWEGLMKLSQISEKCLRERAANSRAEGYTL